ncbi:MAG: aldehyde dehydrogenase family protein [Myxococcales bacterium]|nr:aldehyde dehydrogenase family protein [Myxococcales bacterium]
MNPEPIVSLIERLRATFKSGRTRDLGWRRAQLLRVQRMIDERQDELIAALNADLGKPYFEAWASECGILNLEIEHTLAHLDSWVAPEPLRTPLVQQPGSCYVVREPLGVVLVIGPWNYPLQLVIAPLIGALAAGNCAVLKPSEVTPHTSAAIARLLPLYVDRDAVAVVEGGVDETTLLLEQRFDHIFYTGGGHVGRIVMTAAAKHLTPVTLELGGKSPCIVDKAVDLDTAARRIAWGKYLNAGQTCVAPDYVLVDESLELPLVDKLASTLREFYGPDPRMSPDYGRIVNERHFGRLVALLPDGEIAVGGQHTETERYIAPTIVRHPDLERPLMRDEIFGPILPIVPTPGLDAAIDFINERPKPLALYIFSADKLSQRRVVEETSAGGMCINDAVAHLAVPELPFGGVGASGMGAYHGRSSFETFSHRKSVLEKATWIDVALRYPPYTESKLKWARRLL